MLCERSCCNGNAPGWSSAGQAAGRSASRSVCRAHLVDDSPSSARAGGVMWLSRFCSRLHRAMGSLLSRISWGVLSLVRSPGVQSRAYRFRSLVLSWSFHSSQLRSVRADVRAGELGPLPAGLVHERTTRVRRYAARVGCAVAVAYILAALVHPGPVALVVGVVVAGVLARAGGRRVQRGLRALRESGGDPWLSCADIGGRGVARPVGAVRRRSGAHRGAARRAARSQLAAPVSAAQVQP